MGFLIGIIILGIFWIGLKGVGKDVLISMSGLLKAIKENPTVRLVICSILGGFFILFSLILLMQHLSDTKEYQSDLYFSLGFLGIALVLIVPAVISKKRHDNRHD